MLTVSPEAQEHATLASRLPRIVRPWRGHVSSGCSATLFTLRSSSQFSAIANEGDQASRHPQLRHVAFQQAAGNLEEHVVVDAQRRGSLHTSIPINLPESAAPSRNAARLGILRSTHRYTPQHMLFSTLLVEPFLFPEQPPETPQQPAAGCRLAVACSRTNGMLL